MPNGSSGELERSSGFASDRKFRRDPGIAKESKRAAAQILGQFTVLAYLCADADVLAIHEAIDAFVTSDEKTKQPKPI